MKNIEIKLIDSKVKLLLFFLIFIIVLSCMGKMNNKKNDQYVEVFFLKEGLHFPMQIHCNSLNGNLLKSMVKHIKIDDSNFIKEFEKEYKGLKESNEQRDIDVRIQVIYHNNNINDTICMGSYFDIKVNGVNKEDSKRFLQMIKQKIYENVESKT